MSNEQRDALSVKGTASPRTHSSVVHRRARRIRRRAIAGRAKRKIASVIKSAASTLGAVVASFFDSMVAVTMMTALASIMAVLAYFAPPPTPAPRWLVILCYAIALFGLATITLQVRAILKRKVIREKLGEFLEQGHGLLRLLGNEAAPIPKEDVNAWAKSVEEFLEKNLGRAYIFRFRSNKEFATMSFGYGDKEREGLYKGLYIRVANLEHFAAEIGIG